MTEPITYAVTKVRAGVHPRTGEWVLEADLIENGEAGTTTVRTGPTALEVANDFVAEYDAMWFFLPDAWAAIDRVQQGKPVDDDQIDFDDAYPEDDEPSLAAKPFEAFEVHTVTDVVDPQGPTLYTETVDDADQLRFAQDEGQRIYYTVYGWRAHRMIEPEPIPVYSDDSECYLNGEQVTPESLAAWQQWTTTGEPEGTGLTAISDFIEYEDAMNLAKALSATGNVEINDYTV